jgi:SAM-dependent methyltransferase
MNEIDVQTGYWNSVAAVKTFTHSIPMSVLRDLLPTTAKILDYGCGYGRACSELTEAGYRNVTGIDISEQMIKRGRNLNSNLDLRTFNGRSTGFEDDSFDACLLMAVLTCIPSDSGQESAISEVHRLLRPRGIVFVSDYPLQADERNQKRYHEFEKELGTFGMFRTEGAVLRHHQMKHIQQLLSGFDFLWQDRVKVCTMNGHESDIFRIVARKKALLFNPKLALEN